MKSFRMSIASILFLCTVAYSGKARALDFFGASVSDELVPSAAFNVGVLGVHPVVGAVTPDSPAEKAGVKKGNIILSVNNVPIKKTAELSHCYDGLLSISILERSLRKTATIDRAAIEAEQIRIAEAKQAAEQKRMELEAQSKRAAAQNRNDKLPTLVFNDYSLAQSDSGAVSSAQAKKPDSVAKTTSATVPQSGAMVDWGASYGGRSLVIWVDEHTRQLNKLQKLASNIKPLQNSYNRYSTIPSMKVQADLVNSDIQKLMAEYETHMQEFRKFIAQCNQAGIPEKFRRKHLPLFNPLRNERED